MIDNDYEEQWGLRPRYLPEPCDTPQPPWLWLLVAGVVLAGVLLCVR